jgi:hypothetical protein
MNIFKMRLSPMNCLPVSYGNILSSKVLIDSSLLLLLLCLVSLTLTQSSAIGAVDIDTSGDGRAAAYDGEEGIATDGDSFCSITNDIAGGKFSSLFEGIVGDCDNNNSQISNQFLVEYSYTKNPVEIGEKTYLTITVKDKESGNPISNAFVTLAIEHTPSSLRDNIISTALAAATTGTTTPTQEDLQDRTTQTMYTDNNGHATFTVQLGPKSDMGIYDTEIEITKEGYQSSFQQADLNLISQSQQGGLSLGSNSELTNDILGAIGGDGGDGGDATGGYAIGGDGGDGGDATGGYAIGGDGGDGGDAAGLAQPNPVCDESVIGGDGGNGGDTIDGIQGEDGENGADESARC